MENLHDSRGINRAGANFAENIKMLAEESLGVCRLKQHKLWFGEECSQF